MNSFRKYFIKCLPLVLGARIKKLTIYCKVGGEI
jgi:hypothetical protein